MRLEEIDGSNAAEQRVKQMKANAKAAKPVTTPGEFAALAAKRR